MLRENEGVISFVPGRKLRMQELLLLVFAMDGCRFLAFLGDVCGGILTVEFSYLFFFFFCRQTEETVRSFWVDW